MDPVEEITRRNRWVFHRYAESAETLSHADLTAETRGSYGSIRETMDHVIAALNVWEKRLRGETPLSVEFEGVDPAAGLTEMRAEMDRLTDDVLKVVRDPAVDRDRDLNYRNSRGEEHHFTVGEILMHVGLHGSDHLAQVAVLLTQAGVQPETSDFLNFVDEER